MIVSILLSALMASVPDTTVAVPDTMSAPVLLSEAELLCLDAEDHHAAYEFSEAISTYRKAQMHTRDSLKRARIENAITASVNGRNMSDFCYRPNVVARRSFAISDFFLYYPLPDRSWRPAPNSLDSLGGVFAQAVYMPEGATEYFYAAPDSNLVHTIFETHFEDTSWTAPSRLPFSSGEGEIYPMRSGNTLYFSSKGLFGVGGYDLYKCEWNPRARRWEEPENLGFPYSSPADDFLLINTPDGRYTVFASNRDCPPDSVNVYVLEYDPMPVRSAVGSAEELREICRLTPGSDRKKVNNASALGVSPEDEEATLVYSRKIAEVRALRDSLTRHKREIEALRSRIDQAENEERDFLSREIAAMEAALPELQERNAAVSMELQLIEMDFLRNGVVLDRSVIEAQSDKKVVGAGDAYTFSRKNFGGR